MLVAVGLSPPEPAPPGVSRSIFVGNPKDVERRAATQEISPTFERSIPGPEAEFDFHGGKPRVIATDIYDTAVDVRWRVAPEPDIDAVFPFEITQMARDTEGTQDWAVFSQRRRVLSAIFERRARSHPPARGTQAPRGAQSNENEGRSFSGASHGHRSGGEQADPTLRTCILFKRYGDAIIVISSHEWGDEMERVLRHPLPEPGFHGPVHRVQRRIAHNRAG